MTISPVSTGRQRNGMGIWESYRVQRLIRALKDPDPKVRIDAINSLGDSGDIRAVEPIIQAIQEKENAGILQTRMIVVLGKLQDRRATEILLRVLDGRVDTVPFSDIARLKAVESIGQIADERAFRPLLAYLRRINDGEGSSDSEIFSCIRAALVQIGRKNPRLLYESMKDPDDYIRSEVIRVLRTNLDPESVPVLMNALNDVNYVVRINAAEALGLLRDSRASEPLSRTLRDVNRDVRAAARKALEQIEGREPGWGQVRSPKKEPSGKR